MRANAYDKIKAIYDKTRLDYFVMSIAHLMDIGWRQAEAMTDEDIDSLKGNGLMTADFCKYICRIAREIAQNADSTDVILFCQVEKIFDIKGFKPRRNAR